MRSASGRSWPRTSPPASRAKVSMSWSTAQEPHPASTPRCERRARAATTSRSGSPASPSPWTSTSSRCASSSSRPGSRARRGRGGGRGARRGRARPARSAAHAGVPARVLARGVRPHAGRGWGEARHRPAPRRGRALSPGGAGAAGSSDVFSLEGRVAVVTGLSSGIGQAIAIALARGGADVAGTTDRTRKAPPRPLAGSRRSGSGGSSSAATPPTRPTSRRSRTPRSSVSVRSTSG